MTHYLRNILHLLILLRNYLMMYFMQMLTNIQIFKRVYKLIQKRGNMYAKITILKMQSQKDVQNMKCKKEIISKYNSYYACTIWQIILPCVLLHKLAFCLHLSEFLQRIHKCSCAEPSLFYKWSFVKRKEDSIFHICLINRKYSFFLLTLPRFYDCTHETNQFKRYFIIS